MCAPIPFQLKVFFYCPACIKTWLLRLGCTLEERDPGGMIQDLATSERIRLLCLLVQVVSPIDKVERGKNNGEKNPGGILQVVKYK